MVNSLDLDPDSVDPGMIRLARQIARELLDEMAARGTATRPWLTSKEAAARMNVHEVTLLRWRNMKPPRGPAFHRIGRTIRYKIDQVDDFISTGGERGAS